MRRAIVYLRVPTTRNGAPEEEPIYWDQKKEQKLWRLVRESDRDLDWPALAEQFGVPLTYLQQQAAWLYEKEMRLLQRKMAQIQVQSAKSALNPPAPNSFGSRPGTGSNADPRSSPPLLQSPDSLPSTNVRARRLLSATKDASEEDERCESLGAFLPDDGDDENEPGHT